MTDEMKARRDQSRGERAEALLKNELLVEAFKGLEDAYVLAWRSTNISEDAAREKLFIAINVVGKVKQHLETIAASGSLAKKELADLAKLAEPRKRFGIV